MRMLLILSLVPFALLNTASLAHADKVADAQFKAAKILRKQLPMKVDGVTSLLTAASAGRTLIYSYQIGVRKDELPSGWRQKKSSVLKNSVCNHPTLRKLLKRGASYSYQYVDIDGDFIDHIKISISNC